MPDLLHHIACYQPACRRRNKPARSQIDDLAEYVAGANSLTENGGCSSVLDSLTSPRPVTSPPLRAVVIGVVKYIYSKIFA
jgi:hypothetical protein